METLEIQIFYSVLLSMGIIYYFCKRADNIEYKEKYGMSRKEAKQYQKLWKQQLNKHN